MHFAKLPLVLLGMVEAGSGRGRWASGQAAWKSLKRERLRKGSPSLAPEQVGTLQLRTSTPFSILQFLSWKFRGVGRTLEWGLETGFSSQERPVSALLPKILQDPDCGWRNRLGGQCEQGLPHLQGLQSLQDHQKVKDEKDCSKLSVFAKRMKAARLLGPCCPRQAPCWPRGGSCWSPPWNGGLSWPLLKSTLLGTISILP